MFLLGCGCMTFLILRHSQMTLGHFLLDCKDHQISSKFWERSVKSKSNFNLTRVMNNSSFDQHFLYLVRTFLKFLWWWFLFPRSERFLISSATLSCKVCNISTSLMLVHYYTKALFLRGFLIMHALVCSLQ